MKKWYFDVLTKQFANFEGRARRKSFWLFILFHIIVVLVLSVITNPIFVDIRFNPFNPIVMIYWIITLIPFIAIKVRRLHDTGRSGWWILLQSILEIIIISLRFYDTGRSGWRVLLGFIYILVIIILLIFFLLDSTPGDNKYGPNPKGEVKCTVI